jgi:hypothetical protein
MRRGIAAGLAAAAVLCLIGSAPAQAGGPTYSKDIAPILQKNCQDCHRPGQVAPFSLLSYEQARKRGSDIAHVTGDRIMPPWPAATNYGGPFLDQRVLSDADLAKLREWVEAGCPEGDPKDAPPPREFTSDWALGKPDIVLTMEEPYPLNAEGNDEFRVFVLKTNFPEDRWIKAVDFKPGNRKVVHHIIAGIDASGSARKLDAKDAKPGYEAIGGFGDGVPLRGFLPVWTPGSRARYQPEGSGYILPAKADLLIQVHYHKSGKDETDTTQVGLYLSDKPLPRQVRTGFVFPEISEEQGEKLKTKFLSAMASGKRPTMEEMFQDIVVIPPGDKNYEVKGNSKTAIGFGRPISRDILLTSVMPHMHWLGKNFTFWAILPDEQHTKIPLIKIDHWNFNWQGTYALEKPVRLPKGAYFEMEAHFDNSEANPANPSHPPKEVTWGEQTTNEMCIGLYEYIVAEGTDAPGVRGGRPGGAP